jgi:L-asparaginase II
MERPNQLHNNCSGKHSGFICTCCHMDQDPNGYIGYDHPLQVQIRDVMGELTGTLLDRDHSGIDGCGIPTYAVPLRALAQGFAKMTTGTGIGTERAKASRRLIDACMVEPFYVAGTGRTCTKLMQAAPGRIFAKTGAEGVFCASIPGLGVAIALKCDDGTTRAADAMVAGTLARYFTDEPEIHTRLMAIANHTMRNWNGMEVGQVRLNGVLNH